MGSMHHDADEGLDVEAEVPLALVDRAALQPRCLPRLQPQLACLGDRDVLRIRDMDAFADLVRAVRRKARSNASHCGTI